MHTTTLSTKGQIVLPSSLRRWDVGTEFWISVHANGLRLEPKVQHKTQSAKAFSGMLARPTLKRITDDEAMAQSMTMLVAQDTASKSRARKAA